MPKFDIPKIKIDPEFYNLKPNLKPLENLINNEVMEEITRTNQERWEREEQVAKAIKAVAEIQPQIADALMEMANRTELASKHQSRVNWAIIAISGASLIVGIFGLLIAKGVIS